MRVSNTKWVQARMEKLSANLASDWVLPVVKLPLKHFQVIEVFQVKDVNSAEDGIHSPGNVRKPRKATEK